MNTQEIKAEIQKTKGRIDRGTDAAATHLGNGADLLDKQSDELQDRLRDIGRRLLDGTKSLTDEASRQAQLRPLAVFGVAFVAGVIVARVLRR